MRPLTAIGYAWVAWVISWWLAALWTNRTVASTSFREELRSRIALMVGTFLLFWDWANAAPVPETLGWSMFGAHLAGLAFAWWARLHLGRLWSGHIARKVDHRVVDTGPYGIVRHPIYTGVILAALATGIAQGHLLPLAAAALMGVGFWIRAHTEERFLRRELGVEAYDSYARRVPMLIPFGLRKQ